MKLVLKTHVKGNFKSVIDRFDRDLFEFLEQRPGVMEIKEFTGSKKGDKVHLSFSKPISFTWISHITEHGQDSEKAYFVDEGVVLPFFLGKWKHTHIVENNGENSFIVDQIEFQARIKLFSVFLFPVIYFAFSSRKKLYQQYFGNPLI